MQLLQKVICSVFTPPLFLYAAPKPCVVTMWLFLALEGAILLKVTWSTKRGSKGMRRTRKETTLNLAINFTRVLLKRRTPSLVTSLVGPAQEGTQLHFEKHKSRSIKDAFVFIRVRPSPSCGVFTWKLLSLQSIEVIL